MSTSTCIQTNKTAAIAPPGLDLLAQEQEKNPDNDIWAYNLGCICPIISRYPQALKKGNSDRPATITVLLLPSIPSTGSNCFLPYYVPIFFSRSYSTGGASGQVNPGGVLRFHPISSTPLSFVKLKLS